MRIDRYAATIIANRQKAIRFQLNRDHGRVAGHRFVHRIIDDFGKEVVKRLFIRTTNIHARATTNGLKPLKHLDGRGVIIGLRRGFTAGGGRGFAASLLCGVALGCAGGLTCVLAAKEIVRVGHLLP